MKDARKLGNYIECLAAQQNISASDISKALGCEEHQVKRLFKGLSIRFVWADFYIGRTSWHYG